MKRHSTLLKLLAAGTVIISMAATASAQTITSRTAAVTGGTKVQYLTAGRGPAILLLHGYAQTSRMWRPLIGKLAASHTVIAPDLPGIGDSEIPRDGLDMSHAAVRIHELMKGLGIKSAAVVGHDIGLMVAYSYAAQFPSETNRLALLDAFLPGVDGWEGIYNSPAMWHFRFNGPTPEALVQGRERTYFEYFWNDFAADKTHSIPEADRKEYVAAYSRPGRMHAAWAYFVSFQQAAKDFAGYAQTKLPMPVLSIGGAKASGEALGKQVKLVATNAEAVILPDTGHWIMEERPKETMDTLLRFLTSRASSAATTTMRLQPMTMTPDEVRANQTGTENIGSSQLPGVSSKVLAGDPSKSGFYTIILSVPPNTEIAAHTHRDDRMATVISGTWRIGYGDRFDAGALKILPPGSVYSEPGGASHFARTEAEPVLVQISGYGPTDTHYLDSRRSSGALSKVREEKQ